MNFEHEVQCAICDYLDIRRVCYWAVPNGGKRSKSEANRLKAEGEVKIVYSVQDTIEAFIDWGIGVENN